MTEVLNLDVNDIHFEFKYDGKWSISCEHENIKYLAQNIEFAPLKDPAVFQIKSLLDVQCNAHHIHSKLYHRGTSISKFQWNYDYVQSKHVHVKKYFFTR